MSTLSTLDTLLDGDRFWADVEALAQIGALSPKGIRRLTLDEHDNRARLWLVEQGRALGCKAYHDDLGNVFLRREGQDPSLAPLLIGSHLDSQPAAGIHDGALGVLAGLAVLRTLHEQGIEHRRSIDVVSWTNEEGARFAPGTSGSSWFAGRRDIETIRAGRDDEGTGFGEALDACLALLEARDVTLCPRPFVPHAFLELHIEQGPVLESLGVPVCAVNGIQGVNWYEVEVTGQANHAGTTPPDARRDAMLGAHAFIGELRKLTEGRDDDLRFTIGKFSLAPDSVNTIAERARFTIDMRHPDQAMLDALDSEFLALAERQWEGCEVSLKVTSQVAPVAFDNALLEVVEQSVRQYAPSAPTLVSGAFHDAIHIAHVCPTAMLFTPCRAGISHHPDEHVERADAEVAVRALAHAVEQLLMTRIDFHDTDH
ncbi:M20 family metallo-hydrolase [Halomonas urumqiensis]|uniref:Zn-dependent hydrolase n=1 Tax=Halomonas urumqiensis TaxID=1684789 RepID=A0A2N7UCM1_9GAMM|nr:M20 family metallo-hydrolase [Halomonas urumqiensis]PMR78167.1 Zn-dependent hydrolase [Halomonas urumqiensis]PTB03316.1 Zn-dependent hydrolase [Halomonas urumqiensis]GHE20521.1 Zn-dependent hydrolase [Halomonas urumqiensis]